MSAFLISALVEDAELDPLGAKEALTMAVEPFGWVRLVRVEALEDEQLAMPGAAPVRPAPPPPPPAVREPAQAPPPKRRGPPDEFDCCMTCARYEKSYGPGPDGVFSWGICHRTGRPVYKLIERCEAWVHK